MSNKEIFLNLPPELAAKVEKLKKARYADNQIESYIAHAKAKNRAEKLAREGQKYEEILAVIDEEFGPYMETNHRQIIAEAAAQKEKYRFK